MMFGTVGEHNRMDSTVISDAVNLASRVESSTKDYGISMLITEDLLLSIKSQEKLKIRYIDKINVKGKNIPVKIYEVYNSEPDPIIQLKDKIKPLYEKGLELFYENNFSDCASILEDASQIFPDDKPLQILQEKNLKGLIKDANDDLDAKFALSLNLDNK